MVAGQSCIAGPSGCFLSCSTRLFSGPYPPFPSLGNKMVPTDTAGGRMASAGADTMQAHAQHLRCLQPLPVRDEWLIVRSWNFIGA